MATTRTRTKAKSAVTATVIWFGKETKRVGLKEGATVGEALDAAGMLEHYCELVGIELTDEESEEPEEAAPEAAGEMAVEGTVPPEPTAGDEKTESLQAGEADYQVFLGSKEATLDDVVTDGDTISVIPRVKAG